MKAGIVILNYNDYETVIKLVNKIRTYTSLAKILIVDNNSTDDSFQKLCKLNDKKCEVIKTDKNGGYAYGNNFGVRYLIEKYLLEVIYIANPDVSFENKLIYEINNALKDNEKYGILSGIMLKPDGKPFKKPFWEIPSYLDDIFDCMYLFRALKSKLKQYRIDYSQKIMNIGVVPGSFFGMRSEVFKLIEGFDENTFLFYEENILSSKLKKHGYLAGILTNSSYFHLHSTTIKKNLKVLKTHLIHLKSKYYFQTAYNKIGLLKKIILIIFMTYSLFETAILLPLKSLYRKIII